MIAKVRISRFVQNGIVIRKSQNARAFAGLVAINHAVGRPNAKVINVVATDSFTDRQKIDRFASARLIGLVEDIALEQDAEPAFAGQDPADPGIVALFEDRIDRHDDQRTAGRDDQQNQRGRGQKPAIDALAALSGAVAHDFST